MKHTREFDAGGKEPELEPERDRDRDLDRDRSLVEVADW